MYLLSREYENRVGIDAAQQKSITENSVDYEKFDKDSVRIIAANRGAIQDMAKPVDGFSAENLSVGDSESENIGYLDREAVAKLTRIMHQGGFEGWRV